MQTMHKYLGDLDHLTAESSDGTKSNYVHPALKNTGCVSLVLIREIIAPAVFRNAEQEITDIEFDRQSHVRAVANKFKYQERSRGMQILRAYGVGGRMPQNRTALKKGQKPSEAFDLNALVFGDSANQDNRVLPVKAAVNYSDALGLLPYHLCVEESFHNRAAEDGTLFDPVHKKNSDNLFTRHFVKPGVLLVQVLSTRGRLLPPEGFAHLLLAIGLAGTYGGQTSITGTNVRTRLAGLYGAPFERAETSPYELTRMLTATLTQEQLNDSELIIKAIHGHLAPLHPDSLAGNEIFKEMERLVQGFEDDDTSLAEQYNHAAEKVGELFDAWFETKKKGK